MEGVLGSKMLLTSVDARRRWFGSFFLILAGGFLLWGLTLLRDFLIERPTVFVVYWLACFGLTGLALSIAIYDIRVLRRRLRSEQRAALERAFKDVSEVEENH